MKKNFEKYADGTYLPQWGFHVIREILNGRIAMGALLLIVAIEIFNKNTVIQLLMNALILCK